MPEKQFIGTSKHYQFNTNKMSKYFIGKQLHTNQTIIAKPIKYNAEAYFQAYQQLIKIEHPNVAKTVDLIEYENETYVIREFHNGTNLKTILDTKSVYRQLNEQFFVRVGLNLLKAVDILHQNNILHLDLKPANIIIRHKPNESPKEWHPDNLLLIDFEQSMLFPIPKPFRNRFTLIYSPPEQLLNRLHLLKPASDISSIGVILYEMIAGRAPYVDCNAEMLLHLQLTYPIKKRPNMRDDFFDIIKKATYKSMFPKPPRMLDINTIDSILCEGINQRYQSCSEIIIDLKNYLESIKDIKLNCWKRLMRRIGF